ncbi:MAG: hypothetical protein ABSG16_04640 [Candidatus Acidiferrum sp.]
MHDDELAWKGLTVFGVLLLVLFSAQSVRADDEASVLNKFKTISTVASTVPSNGDVNPYGIVLVQQSVGNLQKGHVLISNFNNSSNAQGTGTTIVDIAPNGTVTQFAQINASTLPGPCPGGVGLTTALAVFQTGWVIVGSLPTSDGTSATAQAGCLIVLDSWGNPVETFYGSLINGPWDLAYADNGAKAELYVTNVLNGTVAANGTVVNQGSVVRINLALSEKTAPWIEAMTVIGSGFSQRTDPNALVIGATGVALSPLCAADDRDDCTVASQEDHRVLYVADTLNNRIVAIPDAAHRSDTAGTGITVAHGGSLNAPLGLIVVPNGHILVVNGDDGYAIEFSPRGQQVAKKLLDNTGSPAGAGALFGLVFDAQRGLLFVDDASNTLDELH